MEVNGMWNCLVTNTFPNAIGVPQKQDRHSDLEWHDGEQLLFFG